MLLRVLEYFEGIMFLTTNRVQTIDPAFKSRIHLSLAYSPLSAESRAELWEIFIIKGTEQHGRPGWLNAEFLEDVSREEVNGREIKNIVRLAHALACHDERPMEADDLLKGLKPLKVFNEDFRDAVVKKTQDYDHPCDCEEGSTDTGREQGRRWWKFWPLNVWWHRTG